MKPILVWIMVLLALVSTVHAGLLYGDTYIPITQRVNSSVVYISSVNVSGVLTKTITICQGAICLNASWTDETGNTSGIYVLKTGDSMTGNLNMSNNSITDVDTLYVHNITGRSPIQVSSPLISSSNITADNFFGNFVLTAYYNKSESDARFYPLNNNPAGYLTTANLTAGSVNYSQYTNNSNIQINYSQINNTPTINTYTNGSGIALIGNVFSIIQSYFDNLYYSINNPRGFINQTLTDTLYYNKSNPQDFKNSTYNNATYLLQTDQRYNETASITAVNNSIPKNVSQLINDKNYINDTYGNATYYLKTNPQAFINASQENLTGSGAVNRIGVFNSSGVINGKSDFIYSLQGNPRYVILSGTSTTVFQANASATGIAGFGAFWNGSEGIGIVTTQVADTLYSSRGLGIDISPDTIQACHFTEDVTVKCFGLFTNTGLMNVTNTVQAYNFSQNGTDIMAKINSNNATIAAYMAGLNTTEILDNRTQAAQIATLNNSIISVNNSIATKLVNGTNVWFTSVNATTTIIANGSVGINLGLSGTKAFMLDDLTCETMTWKLGILVSASNGPCI